LKAIAIAIAAASSISLDHRSTTISSSSVGAATPAPLM